MIFPNKIFILFGNLLVFVVCNFLISHKFSIWDESDFQFHAKFVGVIKTYIALVLELCTLWDNFLLLVSFNFTVAFSALRILIMNFSGYMLSVCYLHSNYYQVEEQHIIYFLYKIFNSRIQRKKTFFYKVSYFTCIFFFVKNSNKHYFTS